MARKTRSDITIGSLEKKLGLEGGAIRNPDGSDARSDKQLGTLQGEFAKAKASAKRKPAAVVKKKPATAVAKSKPAAKSPDQAKAARRVIKANPKATTRMVKKVSAAVKKTTKK